MNMGEHTGATVLKYYKIVPKDIREAHPYVTTGFYAHENNQSNKKGGKK